MSIGLSPDESFLLCLQHHKELPIETRPTLRFRYITGRQRIAIEETFEQTDGLTNSAYMKRCYDMIRQYLVGWSHQGIEFDAANLEDAISWENLLRIKHRWSGAVLEVEDQKKSK